MTRFVPVTVLVVVVAASSVAGAQSTPGTLPNGATLVFEKRAIYDESKNDGTFKQPDAGTPELLHYFNLAHCNCARKNLAAKDSLGTFNYLVRETAQSGLNTPGVDFWVGTTCDDQAHRTGTAATCKMIDSVPDLDMSFFVSGGRTKNFNLYQVVNGTQDTADCLQQDKVSNAIFALVDTKGGTSYDYSVTQVPGALTGDNTTSAGVDTKPPPFPTAIRAAGGERSIHLSWTAPTANNTDVAFYQALCATLPTADAPDGTTAKLSRSNDAQFVTSHSLCGAGGDPTVDAVEVGNSQAATEMLAGVPGGEFAALNEDYICGQADSGTATSLDITGLDNGTPYRVILVSIDLHGNYKAGYFTTTVTPIPSTDFWEDIHNRDDGKNIEGGLCLLAETYGDDSGLTGALRAFRDDTLGASRPGRWLTRAYYATLGQLGGAVHGSLALRIAAAIALAPAVGLALLWHWLTLPGLLGLLAAAWWLRRRRRLVLAWARRALALRALRVAAALAVVTLGAGRAHAGGGYQPYWEDTDPTNPEPQTATEDTDVHWHVGIRIGPYVPDVDARFTTSPGPYEQMFGNGYHILTALDVDRVLWSGFGQLGIGASLGYWQKTARAFTADSMPTDPSRARTSDENKFRLVPMALTATYRFTWLDDEYGIPVVPYARGGLAYYLWWINTADGSLAEACVGGGMAAGCSSTKALGGSLGLQGSIGLAIRAERIDASTAMSMRQSGFQHAGIYGELSLAKVDGFGSDKKLSVGDTTWFAGVDFEF